MKIETLEQIEAAARARKALVAPLAPGYDKPRPAAFILNMGGCVILRLIRSGLYIYEKPSTQPNEKTP